MRVRRVALISIIVVSVVLGMGGYYACTQMLSVPDFSAKPFQCGMSFTTWGAASFNDTLARNEILKMNATGVKWVAVNVWWQQDNLSSTVIHDHDYGWSDTDANLTSFFKFINDSGMNVLFKPMLDSADGYWRSNINASPEWMNAYEEFLIHMAQIAQAGGVKILCVGCEMGSWQVHTTEVRHTIGEIKKYFTGELTYSANHDSFWTVEWWDEMDYIGISTYFPFTISYDPTLEDLTAVWDSFYDPFYFISRRFNKPILFTEVGAQSRDGTNMVPNDNKFSLTPDPEELALYYRSFFQSRLWNASWFKGCYWWMWEIGDPNPITNNGFSPAHPLVKATIELAYKGTRVEVTPDFLLVFVALLVALIALPIAGIYWVVQKPPADREGENTKIPTEKNLQTQYNVVAGFLFGSLISWAAFFYNQATFQVLYSTYSFSQFLGLNPLDVYIAIGLTALGGIITGTILSKLATRWRKNNYPFATLLPWIASGLSLVAFSWLWGSETHQFSPYFVVIILAFVAWIVAAGTFLILHAPPGKNADLVRSALIITMIAGVILLGTSLAGHFAGNLSGFTIICIGLATCPLSLRYCRRLHQAQENLPVPEPVTLEQKSFPPYPSSYKRNHPSVWQRLKPNPNRTTSWMLLIVAFALFAALSGYISPIMLVNFNLDLLNRFYLIYGPALIIGGILTYFMVAHFAHAGRLKDLAEKNPHGITHIAIVVAGLSGAITIGLAQLFPAAGRDIVLLLGGIPVGITFATFILNQMRVTGSNVPSSRASRAFAALAILFTIGLTASGLKIAFVYMLTFFDFVDGHLIVRTDFNTALNWDIPGFVISIYALIGVVLLLIASAAGYNAFRRSTKGREGRSLNQKLDE